MSAYTIPEATGASIRPCQLTQTRFFPITQFGAAPDAPPVQNTQAVNQAIQAAAVQGGTVVFPRGTFAVYTILLASNVNLLLEEGSVIAAAKTDIAHSYRKQEGEGGNYEEPEPNPYVGLQDHGHTYFANSLLYGADLENIMIYGKGLFTGGRFDEDGMLEYVLQGGDPAEPLSRDARGHQGEWFGNKGIALVRCKNIVLKDFSITIGGHFAIIAEGCENLLAQGILVDTTRDAFDIDCCRNVTVCHTHCNSLTDDGLCLKASFGAGIFMPLENVLIEDCTVSGYDAGSVYAGLYTRDKLIALDRCGPTGRVKFGTESTCGYHLVTIRRVKFDRSRGFCLEAVDGSPLTDVRFEDCILDNVSSSPFFLRAGDRGRFPVTGNTSAQVYPPVQGDVRLANKNWILPNDQAFVCYPAKRYAPHYNRTKTVTADGHSYFEILDETRPAEVNPVNYEERDGHFYLRTWQDTAATAMQHNEKDPHVPSAPAEKQGHIVHGCYQADFSREIPEADLPLYANGIGSADLARVANVLIRNVTVTNADPRYPILLMGMTDSHIQNVVLENISVEYRGGLSMEHAVEQRQLNTEWKYTQFHAPEHVQNLPWLVNTFFLKNEGLLPRADWDPSRSCWQDNPYNIPELPEVYPEPSNWGILPAYGLYARHVDGLTLRNIHFSCKVPDGRHVCVLDDAAHVCVDGLDAYCAEDLAPLAVVTHHYRRHTNGENVPEQPYFTTEVTDLSFIKPPIFHSETDSTVFSAPQSPSRNQPHREPALSERTEAASPAPLLKKVEIHAPAPGTPRDSLYSYPTVPCLETGYQFRVDTDHYPLPLTVHRPFIRPLPPVRLVPGETYSLVLTLRCPASDISEEPDDGVIYNEQIARLNYSVKGMQVPLTLSCEALPQGAVFDPCSRSFSWTPSSCQKGTHEIVFVVNDGVLPEKMTLRIDVESISPSD